MPIQIHVESGLVKLYMSYLIDVCMPLVGALVWPTSHESHRVQPDALQSHR